MPDDFDMVQQIRQRDQAALGALYARYGRAVYALALRILTDPQQAEEITQDVFLRLWEAPEKWDAHKGKLLSWLLTVTRYAAIDALRAARRQPALLEAPLAEDDSSGIQLAADTPEWHTGYVLRQQLRALPPEQAQVIQLAFYGGLTHQAIAEQLQLPLGTVKTRLRLGLQKLRDALPDWSD